MLVVKFAFSAKKSWEFDHNSFIYYWPLLTNSNLHVWLRILRSLTLFRRSADEVLLMFNEWNGRLSCQCHTFIHRGTWASGQTQGLRMRLHVSDWPIRGQDSWQLTNQRPGLVTPDQSEARARDNWPIRDRKDGRTRVASVKEFTQDQPNTAPIALHYGKPVRYYPNVL